MIAGIVMSDTLQGTLERIVFSNEETHFVIGEFRPDGARETVTIKGSLPGVQCGETLSLEGAWTRHPSHGRQFQINRFQSKLPSSVYGIRKYLGSGLIPNIGPKFAEKIVDRFGIDTLRIISTESARLREVPGVGPKRAKEIKKAWDEQAALRNIMVFLQSYGVTNALCLRLLRQYGDRAENILREDPYRVANEVHGVGFKTADAIARNLGFSNDHPARMEAGLIHVMRERESEGDTAFPCSDLLSLAADLLEVEQTALMPALEALLEHANLKLLQDDSGERLQLAELARAEMDLAQSLVRLRTCPSALPPIKVDKAVEWAQQRAGFTFDPAQSRALASALRCKISIITGGPGTGKTTILRALVQILNAKKLRVRLAAPTGRAAQRLSEATSAPAQTIHRLLKFDPEKGGFVHGSDQPLSCDFLILDETSMLDTRLAACLMRAVPNTCPVLFVGDIHQLPSVGAGHVLRDLIEWLNAGPSPNVGIRAVTRLEKIFRQSERSEIVTTAHGILANQQHPPNLVASPEDFDPSLDIQFINCPDPDEASARAADFAAQKLPELYSEQDRLMDFQILAPMHKGSGGIGVLNQRMQALANPDARGITYGNTRYQVGDKVMQTRNHYEKGLFNGDLGRVTAVNPESGTLAAEFEGALHDFERAELSDLVPAYAISIHKSQGSEFPVVIIPLLKQHYMLLQRNLLYTAISRGRRKVLLIGDPAAYAMAVRNVSTSRRNTALPTHLNNSSHSTG